MWRAKIVVQDLINHLFYFKQQFHLHVVTTDFSFFQYSQKGRPEVRSQLFYSCLVVNVFIFDVVFCKGPINLCLQKMNFPVPTRLPKLDILPI